jgi:hypothetical protein
MKQWRVVFKKNNGLGARKRVNYSECSLDSLCEQIYATARHERYKPMRAQLVDDDEILERYNLSIDSDEVEAIPAKVRKSVKNTAHDSPEQLATDSKTGNFENSRIEQQSAEDSEIAFSFEVN